MKLPHWNLDEIYPGAESKKFADAMIECENNCKEITKMIEDNASISSVVKKWEVIADTFETLNSYSYAILSVDTENPVCIKAVNKVAKLGLSVNSANVLFINYLGKNKENVEKLVEKGGELESYSFVLNEAIETQEHLMDKDLEDLASDLNRSGTDAFARLQEALASSTTIEFEGKDKTVTELRSYAFNPDRKIRKAAFEKEVELLRGHKVSYAAALNGVKGATITLDSKRSYDSLDRSLIQSRIDRDVLNALIGTLESNLDLFRSYLKKKAEILGIEKLSFYDLFAPITQNEKTYSYEDAKAFILKQFGNFSKEMETFASKAFDNNWIDSEPRSGKIGGAYDIAFPDAKVSRVMCNFDGSYDGVSTIAHELGHAYHDSVVINMPNMLRTYPMTLAETASIFSETIVLQGALDAADKQERIALIESFLKAATQVCVDILCRFYFEREVFEKRAESELTSDDFSNIMVECQKKTYGELAEYHPYMWAVKGHYYSSDFSFYNYPYAFGQLFALGVYAQREKFGAQASQKYKQLLEKTGSMNARDVAKSIGLDIASKAFWQSGIDTIKTFVEEYVNAD